MTHEAHDDVPPAPPPAAILVLDDEKHLRHIMETALTRAGYAVVLTDDGREALDWILQGRRFDLILLNLRMPRMPGREFLERLIELPVDRRPPVVILTGIVPLPTLDAFPPDADIRDIIAKPFSLQRLIESVARHRDAPSDSVRASRENGAD